MGRVGLVKYQSCCLQTCVSVCGSYVYEFRIITEKAEEERREHLRLTLESTGTIYAFGANYDGMHVAVPMWWCVWLCHHSTLTCCAGCRTIG